MDDRQTQLFKSEFAGRSGPYYLRISGAIARLVNRGVFQPGDALPSQRALARILEVDFTTVTRAYEEARSEGLTVAKAGRGTSIAFAQGGGGQKAEIQTSGPLVDLSSVWPPNQQLIHHLAACSRELINSKAFSFLTQRSVAIARDAEAGSRWLGQRLGAPLDDVIVAASGTRNALMTILATAAPSKRILLIEETNWPTVRVVAQQAGFQCVPVPMDEDGLIAEKLRSVAEQTGARWLYCVPSLHNPTSCSMPLRRRRELLRVAQEFDLQVIEDDVYGALLSAPATALYDLAPERVYYISSLSKCISPSLRVAYVACPSPAAAAQLGETLRLSMQAPSPFEGALAAKMILSGAAQELVADLRTETRERQLLAVDCLNRFSLNWHEEGMFVRLLLPAGTDEVLVRDCLQAAGVKVAIGRSFGDAGPPFIRIATGSVSRDELQKACKVIAQTLQSPLSHTFSPAKS